MSSICPKCHHSQAEAGALFCEECGASLDSADSCDITLADAQFSEEENDYQEPPTMAPQAYKVSMPAVPVTPQEVPSSHSSDASVDYASLVQQRVSSIDMQARLDGHANNGISWGEFEKTTESPHSSGMNWDLMAQSHQMSAQPFPEVPTRSCEELIVEYWQGLTFFSGENMPIRLYISPLVDDLTELQIWYSPQISVGGKSPVYPVETECVFRRGQRSAVEIPYCPPRELSGQLSFRFYFGCRRRSEMRYYSMAVRHLIESDSGQGSTSYNITATGAGSINLGGIQSQQETAKERWFRKTTQGRHDYSIMLLEETTWRPERSLVNGRIYPSDRLTLKMGEFMFQLYAQETIRLGRQLDSNDIIIADLLNARSLREFPNNAISRKHAQIQFCGNSVNIFDLSSAGTFVNNIRSSPQGATVPEVADVNFGPIRWQMMTQHCEQRPLDAICSNCAAAKIRSLVFSRTDRVPEAYLLIWQCCDLGLLCPDLAGVTIFRRENGFLLRTPSGNLEVLSPGKLINTGRVTLQVCEYKQYGL